MARRGRDEDFGLKRSSGVDYAQVSGRQVDDERFERQRAVRAAPSAPPVEQPKAAAGKVAAPQSATMDAFMRMMTGKEERTIADRISDPNRPTWEQYKRENADKLDLNDSGEKEMLAYRRKLDAAREKALSRSSSARRKKKKKSKKRSRSDSDSSDSDSDDDRRRSRKSKSRKSKKRHKRKRSSSSSGSESSADERRKSRKRSRKRRERSASASASPVRLSSFFQQQSDSE